MKKGNPLPRAYAPITDAERQDMERMAFNYHTARGQPMRIPPTLYETLQAAGVSMRHMVADEGLEMFDKP